MRTAACAFGRQRAQAPSGAASTARPNLILIDRSIRVDHLRSSNKMVVKLLDSGRVLGHAYVIREIALGNLRQRSTILAVLRDRPQVTVATDAKVLQLSDQKTMPGLGIG